MLGVGRFIGVVGGCWVVLAHTVIRSINVILILLKAVDIVVVGLGGVCTHSHFCVQPNYSVEVVSWLSWVVDGRLGL